MSKNNIDKVIEKCLLAAGKHPERADDNMIISLTKGECKTIYEALLDLKDHCVYLKKLHQIRVPLIAVKDMDHGETHVVGADIHDLLECDAHEIKYYNMQCGGSTLNNGYEFGVQNNGDRTTIPFVSLTKYVRIVASLTQNKEKVSTNYGNIAHCPFCGSAAVALASEKDTRGEEPKYYFQVVCLDCESSGSAENFQRDAIRAWNNVAEAIEGDGEAAKVKLAEAENVNHTAAHDTVNHPSHYCQGGIEVIDYLKAKMTAEEFKGFLRGNVLKYVSRAEAKGKEKEDYEKAAWYLQRLIKEVAE